MPHEMVAIPEKDLSSLLPEFIYAFNENIKNDDFPNGWVSEEIHRFRKEHRDKLIHGKYRISVSAMQRFAHKSFESLVNHTLLDMVKSEEVESGVDADGEITFWLK